MVEKRAEDRWKNWYLPLAIGWLLLIVMLAFVSLWSLVCIFSVSMIDYLLALFSRRWQKYLLVVFVLIVLVSVIASAWSGSLLEGSLADSGAVRGIGLSFFGIVFNTGGISALF